MDSLQIWVLMLCEFEQINLPLFPLKSKTKDNHKTIEHRRISDDINVNRS